jgi:hypothetical protein
VVEDNERLNAVALGTENAEIQIKIEAVDKEIVEIKKEIDEPTDKSENLFTKDKKAELFDKQDKKLEISSLILHERSATMLAIIKQTTSKMKYQMQNYFLMTRSRSTKKQLN